MDKLNKGLELGGEAKQSDSPQRLEGNADQLLPGLKNDIVLDHIVPKLPWRTFHILSSVSPYWRDAIQSRQVHDAKARRNSLETLVVMNFDHPDADSRAIFLYSLREPSWHKLPEVPSYNNRIPYSCYCVALEGSLYVLGGDPHLDGDYGNHGEHHDCDHRSSLPYTGREVFVLDLVEQRGWKRCADLPKGGFGFACGVLDGKVYVLGGTSCAYSEDKSTNECWVYDPKEDRWSSIAPMLSKRKYHQVVSVGDELWVHGGFRWDEKVLNLEVYCPAKDQWDTVEPQHCHDSEQLFTVKGKPYLITPDHIYGREESSKSKHWTQRQSIYYDHHPDKRPEDEDALFRIYGVQAVDHELAVLFVLALNIKPGVFLCRSEGFSTELEKMCLYVIEEEFFEHQLYAPVMCSIDL